MEGGVKELEAGIPAMGDGDIQFLKELNSLDARIINWCRCAKSDIEAAFRTETGAVHISIPVSQGHLKLLNRDWNWVLDQLDMMSEILRPNCDFFSVGAMDASRCDDAHLSEFVQNASDVGFNRIRLADTVGILSPDDIIHWSHLLKDNLEKLEFHGHNDLGMAVANTLTAINHGFGAVSVTLLGLGERAGNAPLEEVLLGSKLKFNRDFGISLENISKLALDTASMTGEEISPCKPLLGSRINQHESGIHVAALKKDPTSFKPYDPTLYGGSEEEHVWGRQSGRGGLKELLNKEGFSPSPSEIDELLTKLKKMAIKEGGKIAPSQIMQTYESMINHKRSSYERTVS